MAANARRLLVCVGVVCATGASVHAQAFGIGPRPGKFPDVVVSSIGATNQPTNYGTVGNITAYAMTTVSCNIGYDEAIWEDDAGSDPYRNQHPVIAQDFFRIKNRRFEQIGFGWLKHGWCAADAGSCTNLVNAAAYAANAPDADSPTVPAVQNHPSCDWLGRFSTDTYGAGLNAAQDDLGPRSEVNAWSGQFPYPYVLNWNLTGNCIYKRVQVNKDDLNPALNSGARYYAQSIYIATDEWPAYRYNNFTYREFVVGALATGSCNGGAQGYNLSMVGTLQVMKPAIQAYADLFNTDADPSNDVKLVTVDVPNDGRFYVASTVIRNGDGTFTYEYAVFNYNCHRSAKAFTIPKSASASALNLGFKDVPYHSGEPFSSEPWATPVSDTEVRWQTTDYMMNPNANALRWSTVYNFRFTSNVEPGTGSATLDLFRPGGAGDPDTITIVGIDVPAGDAPCPADFNGQDGVTTQDLFDFIAQWSAGNPSTDFNGIGGVTTQDLYDYFTAWQEVVTTGGC